MADQRINADEPVTEKDQQSTGPAFDDEFAAQRSQIEAMVADSTRDSVKNAEIRRLAEDLRERVPADRRHEFAPFLNGLESELAEAGPSTGESGTPSALDTGDSLGRAGSTSGGKL